MAQQHPEEARLPARGGDRRGGDRRRVDRRSPPPMWRRWWALVSYGVAGALALVLLFNGMAREEPAPPDEQLVARNPEVKPAVDSSRVAAAPVDAYGQAGFERLTVEGEAAVGRIVRAELYCEAPQTFTVVTADTVRRAVADLIQEGRVPAAECKWGPAGVAQREDFLLLVPPALAAQFASTPVANDAYVERHRVIAEVEWLGRSTVLALRTAGVFRGLVER